MILIPSNGPFETVKSLDANVCVPSSSRVRVISAEVGAVLSTVIVAPLVGVAVIPFSASSSPEASANVWVPSPVPTVQEYV